MNKSICRKLFTYKNGNLYWNNFVGGKSRAGKMVGCTSKDGYRKTRYLKKDYTVHRLIWVYHFDVISEGKEIDHINGKRSDNRIENLRLVTSSENHRNKKRFITNKSGVTGVNWKTERSKWRAGIYGGNKYIFLGYFDNFSDAVEARKKAEKIYKYHANHGR